MKFWQTEHFKALQKAWYQRLEAEGFQDEEEIIGSEHKLKQTSSRPYRGYLKTLRSCPTVECGSYYYIYDRSLIETKEDYYRVVSQRVSEFEFAKDIDRVILSMFAEGAKIKKIQEELERKGTARARHTIRFLIRRYEMLWGLREYTPRQLNRVRRKEAG